MSKEKFYQAFKNPSLPNSISQSPKRAFKDIYELQKEQCNRKIEVLASQISSAESKNRSGTHESNNGQSMRREITDWVKKSSKDGGGADYVSAATDKQRRNL